MATRWLRMLLPISLFAVLATAAPVVVGPKTFLTTASPSFSASGFAGETAVISIVNKQSGVLVASATATPPPVPTSIPMALAASTTPGVYNLSVTISGGFKKTADVTIVSPSSLMAIELDKPLYKPGETVQLRVVAFDANLKPVNGNISVDIQDPSGFIVGRRIALPTTFGVAEWTFPTSSSPPLGKWTVIATMGSGASALSESHTFEMAEYVLPTFAVSVKPAVGFLKQGAKSLSGSVSATYTAGGFVSGTLAVNLWQSAGYSYGFAAGGAAVDARPGVGRVGNPSASSGPQMALITSYSTTIDNGNANFTFSLPSDSSKQPMAWGTSMVVEAVVTEGATGEVHNSSAVVPTSTQAYTVSLTAPQTFKPGLPWPLTLSASNPDGTPHDGTYNLTVSAQYNNGSSALLAPNIIVVTSSGQGSASLTIPKGPRSCCNGTVVYGSKGSDCCVPSISVSLNSEDDNVYAYASAAAASSPDWEFLSVGPQTPPNPAVPGASVSFSVASTFPGAAVSWVLLGRQGVAISGTASTSAPITFTVPSGLGPGAKLLAFYQTSAGVIVDSVDVSVVPTMPQTVSVAFNQSAALPGAPVSVTASASGGPGGRVWLLAVDKSVKLLGGSSALNASDLAAKVDAATTESADAQDRFWGASGCWGTVAPQDEAGAIIFTPLTVPTCSSGGRIVFFGGGEAMADAALPMASVGAPDSSKRADSAASGDAATPTTRLRTLFPETWVWVSAAVDPSGSVTLPLIAPDTITSWELSAFASGASGLGIAPLGTPLSVSQPFYIRPKLPFSLVRNETLTVKVGVFSSLAAAVSATVRVSTGAGLVALSPASGSQAVSVPAGGSATASFDITPSALGPLALTFTATAADGSASDAVQKILTVLPEGFPVTITQNAVVNGTTGSVSFPSSLPGDLVAGSAKATLSVVGDLMGNTIKGLGSLVTVPSGCGEQNMIGLAPNVYVLSYYNATKSGLTADLVAAAIRNTASGYQRELTYRHSDGSFSAFGESDASGSTWLTAFVLKVFGQATAVTFIDPAILSSAISFILNNQAPSGVFNSVGSVIHSDMVSGASGDLAFTAFVLGALLEVPDRSLVPSSAVASAASYLASTVPKSGDVYATVLRAYVLNLACASRSLQCTAAATALSSMLAAAVQGAPLQYWSSSGSGAGPTQTKELPLLPNPYPTEAPSNDVELTGYAVLALITANRVASAYSPAKWLMTQRSALGGYRSTQDTVVGLQALSRYAAAAFDRNVNLQITAAAAGSSAAPASFSVTTGNFDLLQQSGALPAGSNVTVTVSGTGTALVQLSTQYNVQTDPSPKSFDVQTNVTVVTPSLWHVEACVSRTPAAATAANSSAMVMVVLGIFSGWTPVQSSLDALQMSSNGLIKLIEVDGQVVNIYLLSLPQDRTCMSFDITQMYIVMGLADVAAKAYSYYNPDEVGTAKIRAAAEPAGGGSVEALPSDRPSSTLTVGGAMAPPVALPPPASKPPQTPPPSNGASRSLGVVLLATSLAVSALACARVHA